jgi:putative ABC transport system permease protein
MSLIKIAWRSIRQRALASGMTAFAMGLGVALVVTVLVILGVIDQSFRRGALGCDFIIGGKGSQYQLVLNTVFHIEKPLQNIPHKFLVDLQNRYSPIVESIVPVCMGHEYQKDSASAAKYPVIATTQEYFDKLTYMGNEKYRIEEGGRNFKDGSFYEAVIGETAARWLGMKVGDTIKPVAPGERNDEHAHPDFTIVGILAHTGTSNDRAVFINIEGFWRCPAHNPSPAETKVAGAEEHKDEAETKHEDEHGQEADHEHEHDHEIKTDVSAILVCTKANIPHAAELMEANINNGPDAQAVRPVRVISDLLASIIGNIRLVLMILAVLVVFEAGIGIMVSMYNSMSDRKHDIAIMRALGASRFTVMTIILLESILLALGGGLFGLIVGHGMVGAMSSVIAEQSGVLVSGLDFRLGELVLIPGLIVLATLVGYLPAMYAYKTDVAKSLMAGA